MIENTAHPISPRASRFLVTQIALCSVLGLAGGFALMTTLRHLGLNLKTTAPIDLVGAILTVLCVGVGILLVAMSLSPRWTGQSIEMDPDAPPASGRELGQNRLQGWSMIFGGLLLIGPILASSLSLTPRSAAWLYAAIAALFVLKSLINLRIWRRADEFLRNIIAQTSMVSFWTLNAALFLLGAAQKLHLLPAFTLWDACIALLAVYILAGLAVGFRQARRRLNP